MKILSVADITAWEKGTVTIQKLAPAELMERAANALFQAIQQSIGVESGGKHRSFVVLCGPGNNGGDGLAVGRMLYATGHEVSIFLLKQDSYSAENQINQQRLREMDIPVYPFTPENQLFLPSKSIIIDALFGCGLSRPLDDTWFGIVNQINGAPNPVLSVDIPSGLFADKLSRTDNPIVQADITYTFACPKLNLLLPMYSAFTGEFKVLDIGLDKDLLDTLPSVYQYIQSEHIRTILRPLKKFSHKGTYGHACVAGGRYGSIGAIVLAGRAALKTGCGLVTAYIPACGYIVLQSAFPEAQVQTDPTDTHISLFPEQMMGYDAIGVGMGLGTHRDSEKALLQLLEQFGATARARKPSLLLDADAINILAKNPDWHDLIPPHSILTPHLRELERLLGPWSDDFEKLEKTSAWSARYQQIVVIKGANSAIVLPDGTIYFNSTGNPGMATGGSGDALSGIITSLLAQGYSPSDAALAGVYLHGLAGDLAAQSIHPKSIIASDIIEHLSGAWREIFGSSSVFS